MELGLTKLVETVAYVSVSNGLVRISWTKTSLDGMSLVANGEELALTPYIAKSLAMQLNKAVEEFQRAKVAEVKEMKAG